MHEGARRDLTASVLGDLRWLTTADLSRGDEETLRELSARLRRLLVEGTLQLYRKHVLGVRGEPMVAAPPAIESTEGVVHAQAGGADRAGLTIQGMSVWNRALSDDEIKARYEAGMRKHEQARELRLSTWLSETCLFVSGVKASRRDVIKFVANKLGGVHFDTKRNAKDVSFGALNQARESVQLADLDAVYHELSSVGQQLAASAEIRAMVP